MRLFVAVWPPPEVVDRLAALERPAAEGVRWTSRSQWHVTLRFFGSVHESVLPTLVRALGDVGAAQAPTTAVVGPATATFGRSILMVPVSGLDVLAAATVAATSSFGEPPDGRPFAGHLTLARSGGRGRPGRKSRGFDLRRFAGVPVPGSWPVDELTLVRSTTTREGATYDVLSRFAIT